MMLLTSPYKVFLFCISPFFRRSMFPDLQAVKLNTGQQQLYGLVGIRKKVASEQVYAQTANVNHKQPLCRPPTPPLHAISPRAASPPIGMETNFVKIGHVPRTPTPPLQREVVVRRSDGQTLGNPPGLPMGAQSSTLPGQRLDVIVPHVPSSPHAVQAVVVPTSLQTQIPNVLRPQIQSNSSSLSQANDARNIAMIKSQLPGNASNVMPLFNGTNNLGNNNVLILSPQAVPSSSAQRYNVSTVRITSSPKTPSNAPGDASNARKPDVVPGVTGAAPSATWVISTGATTFKTTLPVRSDHAVVRSIPNQARTSEVVSSSQTTKSVDKGRTVMVNGAKEIPALKNASVVSSGAVTEGLSTVNG